jgi:hypothetical protein
VTVQRRDVAKLIVSLPLVGDDPAEPSVAWCCAVCGNELAMMVATGSDKNDEELAIDRVVGSENDAISTVCTMCAECESYYEKMYGMPETNFTTTCSSCGSECTKCTIECDNSNCENCSALCERCVPKGNFLNELGPRTQIPIAKCWCMQYIMTPLQVKVIRVKLSALYRAVHASAYLYAIRVYCGASDWEFLLSHKFKMAGIQMPCHRLQLAYQCLSYEVKSLSPHQRSSAYMHMNFGHAVSRLIISTFRY